MPLAAPRLLRHIGGLHFQGFMLRRTFPCHRGGFVGAAGIRSLGGQRSFPPLSSGNECVLGGTFGEPCRDLFSSSRSDLEDSFLPDPVLVLLLVQRRSSTRREILFINTSGFACHGSRSARCSLQLDVWQRERLWWRPTSRSCKETFGCI